MLEVVLLELEKLILPLEVHEHFFHKAIIYWIVFWYVMTAIFGGERVKIYGFKAVNLNDSDVIHKREVPIRKPLR